MPLVITEVEVINVYPKLAERYSHRHVDYYTIDHRDFFKVTGSDGTIGWGESRARPYSHLEPDTYQHLVGSNPFEIVHSSSINAGLCTALYDLIGKYVGLPVHALLGGDKVREWVQCAAWTRPASPADFQADLQRAADEGYMVFKMHTASHFDPIEQVKAAEACDLPPGFKLHLDFNHNRTLASVLPLLRELDQEHPIVGFIEDPVQSSDLESWCAIREACSIPIIFQSPPVKAVQMLARGPADICKPHLFACPLSTPTNAEWRDMQQHFDASVVQICFLAAIPMSWDLLGQLPSTTFRSCFRKVVEGGPWAKRWCAAACLIPICHLAHAAVMVRTLTCCALMRLAAWLHLCWLVLACA